MNNKELYDKACLKFEKGETYNNPEKKDYKEFLKRYYAEWVVESINSYSERSKSEIEEMLLK